MKKDPPFIIWLNMSRFVYIGVDWSLGNESLVSVSIERPNSGLRPMQRFFFVSNWANNYVHTLFN